MKGGKERKRAKKKGRGRRRKKGVEEDEERKVKKTKKVSRVKLDLLPHITPFNRKIREGHGRRR